MLDYKPQYLRVSLDKEIKFPEPHQLKVEHLGLKNLSLEAPCRKIILITKKLAIATAVCSETALVSTCNLYAQ